MDALTKCIVAFICDDVLPSYGIASEVGRNDVELPDAVRTALISVPMTEPLAGPLDAEFLATARRTVEQYNEARKKRADPYGIAIDCRDELAEMVEQRLDALNSTSSAAPAEAVKRWPFVETPVQFADRLAEAMTWAPSLLSALRHVLIENPAAIAPSTPDAAPVVRGLEWRCFHCDEVFTSRHDAHLHFGGKEECDPACQIKLGAERSMLTALRRAESDAADAWFKLQNESGEAAQAYFAQSTRHQEQLRVTEELGYERGLRDAALHPIADTAALDALPEELAAFLCDEFDDEFNPIRGAQWPEHVNDDGYRGGGYVRLQPTNVRIRARENATRILTFIGQRAALSPAEGKEQSR